MNGSVTVSTNPAHSAAYPGNTYPWDGTYGPGGTGNFSELLVALYARNTDGSGTSPISLPAQTGTTAPDSARTDIQFASKEIEIQAGRNGLAAVTNDNCCHGPIGFYLLSASQTVTVEKVTDFLHVAANPVAVKHGQWTAFTATRDDGGSLTVFDWFWQPDPGQPGNAVHFCQNQNPCNMIPPGSGTATANTTTLGSASVHIVVYSSFTLGASESAAHPGDTVVFTPSYDGSPGPAARWRWVPDDSTGDQTSCDDGTGVCREDVHGAGTMWVYSATSSGDSTSTHITALPRRHLTLSPADTVFATPDSTVTFTATAGGAAILNSVWSVSSDGSGDLAPGLHLRLNNRKPGSRASFTAYSSTTCENGVTTCADHVAGTYSRTVTATVDDSVQTASVPIVAGEFIDNEIDSTCYAVDGSCWGNVDVGSVAGSYVAPQHVLRSTFVLDYTDPEDNLHHFTLTNVTFTLKAVVKTTANWVDAIYATDFTQWSGQSSTIPGERLWWALEIPIRSTLKETLPGSGNYSGGFVQNGKTGGLFFKMFP